MSDPGAGSPFDRGLASHPESSIWHDRSSQYNSFYSSTSSHKPSSTNSSQVSFLNPKSSSQTPQQQPHIASHTSQALFPGTTSSLDDLSSGSKPLSQEPRSRNRAGTLPSRLSPGLTGTRPASLGISNSISLFDNRPSPIGSPNMPPSGSNSNSNSNSNAGASVSVNASNSSLPVASPSKLLRDHGIPRDHEYTSYLEDFPLARSNSSSSAATVPAGVPHTSKQQLQPSASASRLRSGSLNMLSDTRPSFSPFGSSIWSSATNSGSGNGRPVSEILGASVAVDDLQERRKSQQSLNTLEPISTSSSTSSLVDPDPMQPFLHELSMRPDANRLRSYTVNTLPYSVTDEEADLIYAQQQYQKQQLNQRQIQQLQQQQQQQQQYHPMPTQHLYPMIAPNRSRAATVSAGGFEAQFSRMPILSPGGPASSSTPSSAAIAIERVIVDESSNSQPTRSLWVSKLPSNATSYTLQAIFSGYGQVESVRVLTHKNCGFVNFVSLESSIQARNVLNSKELFSGMGPCRVGFAKVAVAAGSNSPESDLHFAHSENNDIPTINVDNGNSNSVPHLNSPPAHAESGSLIAASLSKLDLNIPELAEISDELVIIAQQLGGTNDSDKLVTSKIIKRAAAFTDFAKEVGAPPEARSDRAYDAPGLREVRKKIDSGALTQEDIDDIAIDLLDDIAALSSDYVGNTVVQKLFDTCSEPVKGMMLDKIAPHLAEIGIHKNGTWAAQKIIDVCKTKRQMNLIVENVRPFTPHLFLDQFGNYVIQCCLKFGPVWNDFIFETILSQFWQIAQGRFGARAMRACLESHYATDEQQRLVAATIAEYAVQLAMNTNGALLLTWFLDTCTLRNRHRVLAPRLVPHLVPLCTHKLASLTVLKVLNHKDGVDDSAKKLILDALFGSEETSRVTLDLILSETVHGPTFTYKVLSTTSLLDGPERQVAVNRIRTVLGTKNVGSSQSYKRLMEEVGLMNWSDNQGGPSNLNSILPPGTNSNSTSSNKGRKNLRKPVSHNGQQQQQSQQHQQQQHQQQSQQSQHLHQLQQQQVPGGNVYYEQHPTHPTMSHGGYSDLRPQFEQMSLAHSPGRQHFQQQGLVPNYTSSRPDYFIGGPQAATQQAVPYIPANTGYSNVAHQSYMMTGYPQYYDQQEQN